jgi:hypothetical protein
MKKLMCILFPLCLFACEVKDKQVIAEPPSPIDLLIEPEAKSAQVYIDNYPFLGDVLIVNEVNVITVHLDNVNPEELIIEMGKETLDVDKHGNIRYTPNKVGNIAMSVFTMENERKTPYGKTIFRVMSTETTLGEIYRKKSE